jgi:lipoprotein-releasing system permease protein
VSWHFLRYFISYIFSANSRQRLLLLAISGLMISSFALLTLQGTMGGLQDKVISRSKAIQGDAVIYLDHASKSTISQVRKWLAEKEVGGFVEEYEIELMLKHGNYLAPAVVHAVPGHAHHPQFLRGVDLMELLVPADLGYRKLNLSLGSEVTLISPSHSDSLFGDVPRMTTSYVQEFFTTNVPEIDLFHVWTRLPLIQNLIRNERINRIRIFAGSRSISSWAVPFMQKFSTEQVYLRQWEEENQGLAWSLRLETTVMVFLFAAMTLLVSLSITSGLMLLFDKIKVDFASFWILGLSEQHLVRLASIAISIIGVLSILIGLGLGTIFLVGLDNFGGEILPDIFVDRKIPVLFTVKGYLLSFGIPLMISGVFSYLSISNFKRDVSYLERVRSVG